MEAVRPAITAQQKLEALAALERTPARSKDIAKELGVSEILLYRWRDMWDRGGELLDDDVAVAPRPPPPAPVPSPSPAPTASLIADEDGVVLPARVQENASVANPPTPRTKGGLSIYSPEQRAQATAAYLAKEGSLSQVGKTYGVNPKSLEYWVTMARIAAGTTPNRFNQNKDAREECRQEYAQDPTTSVIKLSAKHGVAKSTVYEWVKDVRPPSNTAVKEHAASVKEQAVAAYLAGEGSELVIADRFDIARNTINRWIKEARGEVTPLRVGRSSPALDEQRERVLAEFETDTEQNQVQLAVRHNLHPKTVQTWIRRARIARGIAKPPRPPAAPRRNVDHEGTHPLALRYQLGKLVLEGGNAYQLAKEHGIASRKSLYQWAENVRIGRITPPTTEPVETMAAHRKYPEEKRQAVLVDVRAGMPSGAIAEKHGVPRGTFERWPEYLAEKKEVEAPMPDIERRVFDKAFKYEVARAAIDGIATRASLQEKYQLVPSVLNSWIKAVRTGKIKAPRKKPGPKPNGHHEIVELHELAPPAPPPRPTPSAPSTQLALPSQPSHQLGRVTSVHEELARLKLENERLKRLLRKTQDMLTDDD